MLFGLLFSLPSPVIAGDDPQSPAVTSIRRLRVNARNDERQRTSGRSKHRPYGKGKHSTKQHIYRPRTARQSAGVEAYRSSNWHQRAAAYALEHRT